MNMDYEGRLCEDFDVLNISEKCEFLKNVQDCKDGGYLSYMWFMYCGLGPEQSIGTVCICVLWLLFMFLALGVTADDFLCPALIVITKTLHLSQNIAGVTFLAFGNGAPDIFSSLAGIEQQRPELVIGELFGAGIFVTTSVVGCICMIRPFKIMERPFLRDIIFYSCAAFWAYYLFYNREIALRHAIGFIVLYIVYIIVVVVSRIVFKKCHETLSAPTSPKVSVVSVEPEQSTSERESQVNSIPTVLLEHTSEMRTYNEHDDDPENEGVVLRRFSYRHSLAIPRKRTLSQRRQSIMSIGLSRSSGKEESKRAGEFIPPPLDSQISKTSLSSLLSRKGSLKPGMFKLFLLHICPIDIEAWPEKPWYSRVIEIFKAPIYFLLTLTTPMVDDEDPEGNWNKAMAIFHCFVGPIFVAFASKRGLVMIGGVFPIAGIAACISIFLAVTVMLTSKSEEPPKYQRMFGYLGFIVSITWIYCLAKEIVALLKAVGLFFGLSDAILGLTVLAWGNSIGDFISNISVAKQGYPRMGISACFGGPLLNLLLGVGVPYTITLVKEGHPMKLHYTSLISLLYGTLCLSLISTMLVMTAFKFQVKRWYGFFSSWTLFGILSICNLVGDKCIWLKTYKEIDTVQVNIQTCGVRKICKYCKAVFFLLCRTSVSLLKIFA